MTDPAQIAVEARESARQAHHRLDRMNGSIDRLAVAVEEGNAKTDEILLRFAKRDGAAGARKAIWVAAVAVVAGAWWLPAVVHYLTHHH